MKEIPNINSVVVLERKNGMPYMTTEGVNFDLLNRFDFIEPNNVKSNDIQAISKRFGVIVSLFRLRRPELC
jgi:hypothetical protein